MPSAAEEFKHTGWLNQVEYCCLSLDPGTILWQLPIKIKTWIQEHWIFNQDHWLVDSYCLLYIPTLEVHFSKWPSETVCNGFVPLPLLSCTQDGISVLALKIVSGSQIFSFTQSSLHHWDSAYPVTIYLMSLICLLYFVGTIWKLSSNHAHRESILKWALQFCQAEVYGRSLYYTVSKTSSDWGSLLVDSFAKV